MNSLSLPPKRRDFDSSRSGFLSGDLAGDLGAYGYPDPDPVLQRDLDALISLAQGTATQLQTQETNKAYNAYLAFRDYLNRVKPSLQSIINNPIIRQFRPELITQAQNLLNRVNAWK